MTMITITMTGFLTTPTRFGHFPVNGLAILRDLTNRIGDANLTCIGTFGTFAAMLNWHQKLIHLYKCMQHDACIDDVGCCFLKEQSWKQFDIR